MSTPEQSLPYVQTEEEKKKEEQSYEWTRWLTNPLNEVKAAGKTIKTFFDETVDDLGDRVGAAGRMNAAASVTPVNLGAMPLGGLRTNTRYNSLTGQREAIPDAEQGLVSPLEVPSMREGLQGGMRGYTQPFQYVPGMASKSARTLSMPVLRCWGRRRRRPDREPNARLVQGVGQFAAEEGLATAVTGGLSLTAARSGRWSPADACCAGGHSQSSAIGRQGSVQESDQRHFEVGNSWRH